MIFDARLELNPLYRGLPSLVAQGPVRKVLVISVDVPARHTDLEAVIHKLKKSRHNVSAVLTPLGDRGKFQNINAGLLDVHVEEYDWLIVIDDNIDIPADFSKGSCALRSSRDWRSASLPIGSSPTRPGR